jgi:hypothetical protein
VARHTIHKPSELSKSCPGAFDESNTSGGDTDETRAGPVFRRSRPVTPSVKTGRRELESGDFVDVVGFFTPCGKPARAGRLDRIGGRRRSRVDVVQSRSDESDEHCRTRGVVRRTDFSADVLFLRKEVIQPQVPLRLPCYDLVPIRSFIFGACLSAPATSDAPPFGGLTGGVYKAQEHIHRGSADPRLLAIPTSWTRIAESNLNWGTVFAICSTSRSRVALSGPL